MRYFCLQFTVYVPFSGPSGHLSRQPLLCQPLSSRFALRGLRTLDLSHFYATFTLLYATGCQRMSVNPLLCDTLGPAD